MIAWEASGLVMTLADSLRDVRYFVAVYEERSFTAAAEREGATQSGVSQHIRKLEARAGMALFLRGPAQVTPTPAADLYYRHCVELLRINDAAGQALRVFTRGLDGTFGVGLMPTMTRCVLAGALVRFHERHPNVVVRVVEAYSAALLQQVRTGDVAFAVVPAGGDMQGLRAQPFARTPELLVTAGDRPHHRRPVRLADLPPLRIVTPAAQNARAQTLRAYLAASRATVAATMELDTMFATLDLVARTDWVAILPGVLMAADAAPGRYTIRPLADPPLALDLVAVQASSRALPAAAAAFLGVLAEETARLGTVWGDAAP